MSHCLDLVALPVVGVLALLPSWREPSPDLARGLVAVGGATTRGRASAVGEAWGVHAVRERRDVRVREGSDLPVGSPVSLPDAMAAVSTAAQGADVTQAAQWVARTVPDASLVVIVTGSVADAVTLRRAARVLPVDAVALVLACTPGRGVEVSGRDGVTLARVGELLDVQRIVRSVLL